MLSSQNCKLGMPQRAIDLTPEARDDWRSIWDYGVEHWSRKTAEAYYNGFADRLEALALGRTIGFPVLSYPGLLKSPMGSHVVYYRLSPSSLFVVRILHHSMDTDRKL